jgi:hypothetical protein
MSGTFMTEIKQCIQRLKNKSWPPIMPKQRECDVYNFLNLSIFKNNNEHELGRIVLDF